MPADDVLDCRPTSLVLQTEYLADFGAPIQGEKVKWGQVIREIGLKLG